MKKLSLILFLLLPLYSLALQSNFSVDLAGTLDNKLLIMHLVRNHNTVTGYYGDAKDIDITYVEKPLWLSGTISDKGCVTLSDDEEKRRILFKGELTQQRQDDSIHFTGYQQISVNGKITHSQPFVLKQQKIKINQNGRIVSHYSYLEKPEEYYFLQINYPQIETQRSEPYAAVFNKMVADNISDLKKKFLQDVKEGMAYIIKNPMKDMPPLTAQSNSFYVDYEITHTKNNMISIRFTISTYYYGAAHPNTYTKTLNYDLKKQQELSLQDLFKPGSGYLQRLAAFCYKTLHEKFINNNIPVSVQKDQLDWLRQGTEAKIQNYQSWNILPDDLLITFDPYQVAPYAYGRQDVLVPFSYLQNSLKGDYKAI